MVFYDKDNLFKVTASGAHTIPTGAATLPFGTLVYNDAFASTSSAYHLFLVEAGHPALGNACDPNWTFLSGNVLAVCPDEADFIHSLPTLPFLP